MGKDKAGLRDLIAALARIADAMDRLVQLGEDFAEVIELPISDRKEEVREEAVPRKE